MSLPEYVQQAVAEFPQMVQLENGDEIELRPAESGDKDPILEFARGLSEQDLLFLRVDITSPEAVVNWLNNVSLGETVSLLAWAGERVVGYGTVDRNSARWTRRVGELRVNIASDLRSQGLGRHLTSKIFDIARNIGLRKLVAHMTPDQVGAQAAFSRLGFRPEALLGDYVEDRDGNVHDLTIMAYDIDGLTSVAEAPLQL